MRIARGSIDRPLPTWIVILVCLARGLWAFLTLGRLEYPAFTIKQVAVETHYPGASAQQVAEEVSEPLESAIQKMSEVERIDSINRPGVSQIEVHIESEFDGSELPAIWTELRARVGMPRGDCRRAPGPRWSTTGSATCSASTTPSPPRALPMRKNTFSPPSSDVCAVFLEYSVKAGLERSRE